MPVMRQVSERPDWVRWSAFGIGVVDDAEKFDRHYHDADEYWLIFEGRARVTSEGQEYVIGAGDIVCTRKGEEHDIVEILDGPLRCFWIEDELRGRKRPGHLHKSDSA